MLFLGVDVGGTTVKYSLISQDGEVSESGSFPTASKDAEDLLKKIVEVIQRYHSKYDIQGIGISSPGVIDPYEGRVLGAASNMPEGWKNVGIKEYIEKETNLVVVVDNDVNCAAMGEHWMGAAQECENFICIALGTGVGAGIVINNRLYYGSGFQAGEVCFLGSNKGTTDFWEKKVSTNALVARVKESLLNQMQSREEVKNVNGMWIFEEAEKNEEIRFILEDWADELAGRIADIVCVLNPQAVILGGGISAQGKRLIDLIEPRLKSYLPLSFVVELKTAQLENDAAKLGAVKRLIDEQGSK